MQFSGLIKRLPINTNKGVHLQEAYEKPVFNDFFGTTVCPDTAYWRWLTGVVCFDVNKETIKISEDCPLFTGEDFITAGVVKNGQKLYTKFGNQEVTNVRLYKVLAPFYSYSFADETLLYVKGIYIKFPKT